MQLPIEEKHRLWILASPWLHNISPRDSLMPKDDDGGFFPTTRNELKHEAITSTREYRVRVLVCAPSNSALDEIVLRVLSGGIHDENDRAYCPKIVRIGLRAHHSIKVVSLDELVIGGIDVAVRSMKGGGIRRVIIPPSFGYKNTSEEPIPPNAEAVYYNF
ncbi:probable helicase MAGATAMA 3 [Vicia villosa]|uniref:probable helicase MAGATAMA 3 n=1 Tax=Vicia villosa TaxID=3911 RepID=UPI00273AD93D|nr:probable helicase MAGATAMA 3 [Vicia villosa]XP_058721444.1 probable helicase MAGATAMA 3 [Vicia villosa]XP_058721445.1 probable helicase MAGATAMA 3 [Vicia villosa]XP_058721446.1 probable helicase MAGATAMA 3 [Vicia villosa]XP_058721447.1 probable helicase MAGATAMA 3 [Vicia villosa]XP_058721448.1 probable helicase MAGATAMA 3 [Vicia villosa]XP_058721449.1 probable helicase MAGATAMA 3 [Vicia villosa]